MCMHICLYVYMSVCMCICLYVCMYVYMSFVCVCGFCAYSSAIYFLLFVSSSLFDCFLSCKLMSISAKGLDILLLMCTRVLY